MRRMERRMYKRRRGQAIARRTLLCTGLIVLAVMLWRNHERISLKMQTVAEPTATPITARFDETVQEREIILEQNHWYAIQTGIFSSPEAAEKKADAYTDRGAPGYVAQDGEKWRVFIACYGDKADASAVRARLSEAQSVETYLYEWSCPQVKLRLSGMAGQLDVVEAGLKLMDQTALMLRDQAAQMDSSEQTMSESLSLIEQMDQQINTWAAVTMERFARPYPEMVNVLLEWTQAWEKAAAGMKKAAKTDATQLSAELKAKGMALYERNIRFREELQRQ